MVVNVPTLLACVRTELPRKFSPEDTVFVNLKRRLCYKGFYEADNVRPWKIIQALRYLIENDTLWREAHVTLDPEWVLSAAAVTSNARQQPHEVAEDA